MVEVEPTFKTSSRLLKPDAIARTGSRVVVVDAQIVGERVDLDRAHQSEITKYAVLEGEIRTRYSVTLSLTLSPMGAWSKQSFESSVGNSMLKSSNAEIISTRALIGGLSALNIFNHRTSVRRRAVA